MITFRLTQQIVALKETKGTPFTAIREGRSQAMRYCSALSSHTFKVSLIRFLCSPFSPFTSELYSHDFLVTGYCIVLCCENSVMT